jgi:hypothetical protein
MKHNAKLVKTQERRYLSIQERGVYNHIRIEYGLHRLTVSVLTGHGDLVRAFYNLKPLKVPSLVRMLKKHYMVPQNNY